METLNDIQEPSILRALNAPLHRHIFGDELGCGKSRQALEVCRRIGAKHILIVCPAQVRPNWRNELQRWYADAGPVGVIAYGQRKQLSKARRASLEQAMVAPVRVTSYGLAGSPWLPAVAWDAILFDEVDLLQHADSGWSTMARQLVARNPRSCILGLTGTLMPNAPADAWNVVDTIWPGRLGLGWENDLGKLHPNWAFMMRYTIAEHNEYGWNFRGVNDEYQAELRERLSFVTTRITRKRIAHLLPPYQVRQVEADVGDGVVAAAVTWARDALVCSTHIFIAAHFRRTVREIAERLAPICANGGASLANFDGSEGPEKRMETLDAQRKAVRAVTVATMHSVGRGITLGWNQQVLLAELYWRPATVVQFLGRVGRVGDSAGAVVDIMSIPGTNSERIAHRLVAKCQAINFVTPAGAVDEALTGALAPSESSLLAQLNDLSDVPDAEQSDWLLSAETDDDDEEGGE